jgi:hypothetical protein
LFIVFIGSPHSLFIIISKGGDKKMNKEFLIFIVLGLMILGVTQVASATETVVNEGSERSCFLDYLSEENREKAENIIREFHSTMTTLRERMTEIRGTGDIEARDEIRSEMTEAKETKRTEITNLLPLEVQEEYQERALQGQRKHSPVDSQVRAGRQGGKQSRQMASTSESN